MSATAIVSRGPAEHERRHQIVLSATEHFRHYGYKKTTVADLARAIGLSTAYIYKFFDSKQSIGESVCSNCVGKISAEARRIAGEDLSAEDKLRRIFRQLARDTADLFFHDRKMLDLVAASFEEGWSSAKAHEAAIQTIIEGLLREGREKGEFERKTPLQEACRAIMLTLQPFFHPYLIEAKLDTLDEDAALVASLVLRSLAP